MRRNIEGTEGQTDKFLAQVREHFRYLVSEFDFDLTEVAVPRIFDNRLVQFESSSLGVRIVRDRGSILISVSLSEQIAASHGLPHSWYGIGSVLALVKYPTGPWEFRSDPGELGESIPEIARHLRGYMPAILEIFGSQNLGEVVCILETLSAKPFLS